MADEILQAPWSFLVPHYRRDAVFFIDACIPLTEVAAAVSQDDTGQVAAWVSAALMRRPTPAEVRRLATFTGELPFVIVQPYVLVEMPG